MQRMVPVFTSLPEDELAKLDERARSQYLSRSAAFRQILLRELNRDKAEAAAAAAESEVAA
jgi:metal-responsive CopG/Arc/MetJ family transcriptional regulator